jgi:hypothetical protein
VTTDPFDPPNMSGGELLPPNVIDIQRHTASRDTAQLKDRLWRRFSRDHAVLYEVPIDGHKLDSSGNPVFSRQSIDAVAVGLWRRTNYLVHAFELKATVRDLEAELRNPIKARAAFDAADRFWLVVHSRDLLLGLDDVIPPAWGLIIPRGESLTTIRQAGPAGAASGQGIDRGFVAGITQTAINRFSAPALYVPAPRRHVRARYRYQQG